MPDVLLVNLPPELLEILQAEADCLGVTLSAHVVARLTSPGSAVDAFLDELEAMETAAEAAGAGEDQAASRR